MGDLKILIYLFVCVGNIGCQVTTDTCISSPGVQLKATSNVKYIVSPGFPNNYANNQRCRWIIRNAAACGQIRIEVKTIQLESGYDKLRLSYGSNSITVVDTTDHVIHSENVTISFTSDDSTTYRGFKLSYSITGCRMANDMCRSSPGVILYPQANDQFITSPGFPDNYANDLSCYWTIRSTDACQLIRIAVKFIELEGQFDKLQLSYGSSGNTRENITTTSEHVIQGESVTISFISDRSNTYQGFRLSYSTSGCLCVHTSEIDVSANETRRYIASPTFPSAYARNTICKFNIRFKLNIATSTVCTLLRLDTPSVEIYDPADTPMITYDGGHRDMQPDKTYHIPSNRSVVLFKTEGLVAKQGFNISYQAEDIHTAKNALVFGCNDSQLVAEAKTKYVHSASFPQTNMDTDCDWMIFATEPCSSSTVSGSTISIVVEEFKTNGSSPITIFQAAEGGDTTIFMSQDSSLIGRPMEFHVTAEEFVLITVRHIGESSAFKLSYQTAVLKTDPEHQSDNTLVIALALTICTICIVTVIAHIVVRHICQKRSSRTKPGNTVTFHNERSERTTRPYVVMGKQDTSENENQREASDPDETYNDVANAATGKQDDYYYMEKPGAEYGQCDDVNLNTDSVVPEARLCIRDDERENENQHEASITADIYENVTIDDDLGTGQQDYYYVETVAEAEHEHRSEINRSTGANNVFPEESPCSIDDENVYEVIEDYNKVSTKRW